MLKNVFKWLFWSIYISYFNHSFLSCLTAGRFMLTFGERITGWGRSLRRWFGIYRLWKSGKNGSNTGGIDRLSGKERIGVNSFKSIPPILLFPGKNPLFDNQSIRFDEHFELLPHRLILSQKCPRQSTVDKLIQMIWRTTETSSDRNGRALEKRWYDRLFPTNSPQQKYR